MHTLTIRLPLAVAVLATGLTGCVFKTLEKDLEKLDAAAIEFNGKVTTSDPEARSVIVVAMHDQGGENIEGFSLLAGNSDFQMRLPVAATYFLAFNDLNQDLRFQADEPFAWSSNASPADPENDTGRIVTIELDTDSGNGGPVPTALVGESLAEHIRPDLKFNIGTVSSLDNPWFSMEQAHTGLWEPYAFMAEGGTGIHFLEPYDPDRIPVLFVHGVNGTPRNFAALIESVDAETHQAWFYSYPSGLPLDWLSAGMARFLGILHAQHGFDELQIVAHSMGGLVSRGGINQCLKRGGCDYLTTYITISTPWGGVESAKSGVQWAPTVVPVWRDLDPASDYITTLFDSPLPDSLPYYLLFGFRQDGVLDRGSSDGVIKLSSQLRQEAQVQADFVRGYDEDHVSILSNPDVITLVNQILGPAGDEGG